MSNKGGLNNTQQGSGSAENKGGTREEQQSQQGLSSQDRKDIANEMGEDRSSVIGLKDLGAASGRDDASGGDNDGMRSTNSGENTER